MKNKYLQVTLATLLLSIAFFVSISSSGIDKNKSGKLRLRKPDIVDLVFVNYNNWSYVMRNNGSYMYDAPDADHNSNNAGGIFPRSSGVTIVYAGGVYIGALKDGIPVVSETEFSTEFQPGRIVNNGVSFESLKAEDPLLPSLKVHLIDRNDTKDWPEEALRDQFGSPALIADAQTWAVFNDLDTSLNQESLQESPNPGLGIEVVLESYAFNAPKIGDVVFLRYTLANKTTADYTQSYFASWMDADVDNATNDIVGTDTARGMAFVYNISNEPAGDKVVGFDILQGPVVHDTEIPARDLLRNQNNKTKLTYDLDKNRFVKNNLPSGRIALGAVSSNLYSGGMDPVDNKERYNLMRGAEKSTGIMKFGCGLDDYFVFRGNPLTEQGTCDVAGINNPRGGLFATAADQRMSIATGPFTIKAGESQEIWVGVVGASGNNRLDAVANLFATDDIAQSFFDAGFPSPAPPEIPNLSVTALDGRVSLTWQNNAELSDDLAGDLLGISVANGYNADYVKRDFQGYRVYRSLTGLDGSFQLRAQYDAVDTLGLLSYRFLNNNSNLEIAELNFGTNTGLRYSFIDSNLTNGQNYFYSVTAYDAQPYIAGPDSMLFDGKLILKPSGIPVSLESSILSNTVSAVPQKLSSSFRYDAMADSSHARHIQGVSDGYIELEVANPAAVVDADYTVEFYELPDSVNGKAVMYSGSTHAGQLVFRVMKNFSPVMFSTKVDDKNTWIDGGNGILDLDGNGNLTNGDQVFDDRLFSTSIAIPGTPSMEQFDICEGVLVKAFRPELKGVSAIYTNGPQYTTAGLAAGTRWFNSVNFGLPDGLLGGGVGLAYGFFGSPIDPADLKTIELRFSRTVWQTAYGHTGAFGNNNEFFPVPFTVWDVDQEDALPDRRLNVMCRDGSAFNGNGWYLDNVFGGDGSGPYQRNYAHVVLSDYDSTVGSLTGLNAGNTETIWSTALTPRERVAAVGAPADGFTWNDLLKTARTVGSPSGTTVDATERDAIYAQIPDEGILKLTAPNLLTSEDQFSYSTTARTAASKSDTKRAMKNIKVVPNPFYKYSSFETSLNKLIKFTNLPSSCTIKIFTVAGDLIRTLNHNSASDNDRVNNRPYDDSYSPADDATSIERWDLKTANGRYVASGMYIALVESAEGKRLVKFAIIQ
ncbi:hypothetical protein F9K33_03290 [bacterium]|nr:MAG: hypothetical protein F9K33_03290 [bacterium]